MYDKKQRVFFPEPIAQRCDSKVSSGWQQVVRAQTADFGLTINPDHHDAAERNFKEPYPSTLYPLLAFLLYILYLPFYSRLIV